MMRAKLALALSWLVASAAGQVLEPVTGFSTLPQLTISTVTTQDLGTQVTTTTFTASTSTTTTTRTTSVTGTTTVAQTTITSTVVITPLPATSTVLSQSTNTLTSTLFITSSIGSSSSSSSSTPTRTIPTTGLTCAFAENCQPRKSVCLGDKAVCRPGECIDGFFNDETILTGSPCQSCKAKFNQTCVLCNSTACLDCGQYNYFDPMKGVCTTCNKFGPLCLNCTATECTNCGPGNYFNRGTQTCAPCQPTLGCSVNNTFCVDATLSTCLKNKCNVGYYNSLLQPNSSCIECNAAVGCRPGKTVCQNGQDSYCLPGECRPYWYNSPVISQCEVLGLVMETTMGPEFLNDTLWQMWWLDSWHEQSSQYAGRVRIDYPTSYQDKYFLRIYSNEDRSNLTDIGWDPQDWTTLGPLALADYDLFHRFNISCFVKPDVATVNYYGTYQRAICLGCEPIENCLTNTACNGVPWLPTCPACAPGFFLYSEYNQPDKCLPCGPTILGNCPPEYRRCNATHNFCAKDQCGIGYMQTKVTVGPDVAQTANDTTNGVYNCSLCPFDETCQPGFQVCTDNGAGQVTLGCAAGKCKTWMGYYNQVGDCPDNPLSGPCKRAPATVQTVFTPDEITQGQLLVFEDQINQAFGTSKASYPADWIYILGTRLNATSGKVLIDLSRGSVTSPNAGFADQIISGVTTASAAYLSIGIQCVAKNVECDELGFPTKYDPHPKVFCSPCAAIANCNTTKADIVCPDGPWAARCPICSDGFWNNASTGYYPDACTRCPNARNCTIGQTVCSCPSKPMCKSSKCNTGFFNNPAPPPLDCAASDTYQCWDKKTYEYAANGNIPSSVGYELNDLAWISRFGLAHVRRFISCPNYGKCVHMPAKNYLSNSYWKYDTRYWDRYYDAAVKELQGHPCWGSACSEQPRPEFASPCRRWRPYCNEGYYEYQAPTSISDRVCKKCTKCNYSFQWRRVPCSTFIDTQCVNCARCPDNYYYIGPCQENADTQCGLCTSVLNCVDDMNRCTNSTNSWCLQCSAGYWLNNTIQSDGIQSDGTQTACESCTQCPDGEYPSESCAYGNLTYDPGCTGCPDAPHCQPGQSTCNNATSSVCNVGSCNTGYHNTAESPTCILDGVIFQQNITFVQNGLTQRTIISRSGLADSVRADAQLAVGRSSLVSYVRVGRDVGEELTSEENKIEGVDTAEGLDLAGERTVRQVAHDNQEGAMAVNVEGDDSKEEDTKEVDRREIKEDVREEDKEEGRIEVPVTTENDSASS
eukprot:comp23836_c1_seq1/m.41601 comp23836_c1_seq1/g.41601  ORF comp23836_c1_seq1/g.41601 comp23836_c1_seq1/m.41601 type:complete len:1264 (-) comp23836_c1_seq1:157-3948(-)